MLSRKCVDTAAEAIATHREAKLFFMQGLVKRILREAYREPTPLPSVGTPLVQSVFTGAPPPSKSSPYFVTHPNYHNGQFYLSGDNIPMSHSPKTSAQASSANYSQMDIPPTTTTPSTITPSSTTAPSITTSSTPSTSFHSSSNAAVSRSEVQRAFTLFGPITLVESLTKTQHLLVADIKRELQSLNNQLSNIPIAEIRNEQIQAANILTERMEALERSFAELKDVIMLRTNQTFQTDQELLEKWDPAMILMKKSPWENMRLILNKVASDNLADLFPSDWCPKHSELQEKHFKIMSEGMTHMFYQCGILQECQVVTIQEYEQFLRALHHHMVMGYVTINQLGQFLILMTYMSFCRMTHYTEYMKEEDAVNLKIAVWMSLVIIAFRTTFHSEDSIRSINKYFKVMNTTVRRRMHVIITRYLEQKCVCRNHVQCDLFPNTLTTEITLPIYQHFLQYLQEKGFSRFSITNESEALLKYGKTITMIVLARVNSYYSSYFPQSIMEEESRCLYGHNFSSVEKDYLTNKLLKMTPTISKDAVQQSIEFLERQKEANCPCTIHTQKRGYDWIVFDRMPDKFPSPSNMLSSGESESKEYVAALDTTINSQDSEKMGEDCETNNTHDVSDASIK